MQNISFPQTICTKCNHINSTETETLQSRSR